MVYLDTNGNNIAKISRHFGNDYTEFKLVLTNITSQKVTEVLVTNMGTNAFVYEFDMTSALESLIEGQYEYKLYGNALGSPAFEAGLLQFGTFIKENKVYEKTTERKVYERK